MPLAFSRQKTVSTPNEDFFQINKLELQNFCLDNNQLPKLPTNTFIILHMKQHKPAYFGTLYLDIGLVPCARYASYVYRYTYIHVCVYMCIRCSYMEKERESMCVFKKLAHIFMEVTKFQELLSSSKSSRGG